MAAATQNTTERRAMLRRVAIVISSLPESTGRMLLGSLGPQMKTDVNRILRSLNDIDPLERRRAIEAFRTSLGGKSASSSLSSPGLSHASTTAAGDEFVRSSASTSVSAPAPNGLASGLAPNGLASGLAPNDLAASSPDAAMAPDSGNHLAEDDSPLRFLAKLDDPTLVAMLNVESAQTIAIVFSSLAPHQAARLLPQIASHLQRQVVLRLGRLGEVPEFAAAELADHFQGVLERRKATRSESKSSTSAVLEAILASLPRDAATTSAASPSVKTPPPAAAPPVPPTVADRPRPSPAAIARPQPARPQPAPAEPVTASPHAESLDRAIRNLQDTMPERFDDPADPDIGTRATIPIRRGADQPRERENPVPQAQEPAHEPGKDRPVATPHGGEAAAPSLSTDQVEQRLKTLSPQQLCHSLARVNTRQAVLTLCGVAPSLADATLALLPKPTADTVRTQMLSLQTMNLREIDRAKSAVAAASLALEAAEANRSATSGQRVASAAA